MTLNVYTIFILVFFICHYSVGDSKEITKSMIFNNTKSYIFEEDDELLVDDTYDDRMFFSEKKLSDQNRVMDSNVTESELNCFGLSSEFSTLLESYFKKAENGTQALQTFFYVNSKNQSERMIMRHGESFSLENVDFDIKRRTIFIIHGFLSYGKDWWIMDMENAFLQWDDVNIFVVDWSDGANTWNYLKAAVNTKTVGYQIVTFINQIMDHVVQNDGPAPNEWGRLHLIGHSLGAHICGYAAHKLNLLGSPWPVHRITGLDPAQPCFRNSHMSLRLDRSDAEYVDVIHTNGKVLSKMGLGLPYPLGHVDFYPNGGGLQPGCWLTGWFWKFIPLPIEKIAQTICSHGRSYVYFTESIITAARNNCSFWATEWDMRSFNSDQMLSMKCNDKKKCMEMGINSEKYENNGTYFSVTGGSSPYCNVDDNAIEEIKTLMSDFQ